MYCRISIYHSCLNGVVPCGCRFMSTGRPCQSLEATSALRDLTLAACMLNMCISLIRMESLGCVDSSVLTSTVSTLDAMMISDGRHCLTCPSRLMLLALLSSPASLIPPGFIVMLLLHLLERTASYMQGQYKKCAKTVT